jgi:hypothetical protein
MKVGVVTTTGPSPQRQSPSGSYQNGAGIADRRLTTSLLGQTSETLLRRPFDFG